MKLPAVAIAATFAGGIVLGSQHFFLSRFSAVLGLPVLFFFALLAVSFGVGLALKNHLRTAVATSLVSWAVLGMISACVAGQPLPSDHVLTLLNAGRLDLSTPLRWQGRLRDEPRRLPWGYGTDVDLNAVDFNGDSLPLRGGMRVTYVPGADGGAALPELHAGDQVTFVAKAQLPANYRDDGAFDRRAYLAQQGIHLNAALRATELIERNSSSPATPRYWIARARTRLRDTLDALFPEAPETAAILRAMLLGDRTFLDRDESKNFQITGTYHVLVVAGLHVTALAVFLFWGGRALRLPQRVLSLLTLVLLLSYVSIVEQRPPVLRAALMAGIVVFGRMLFRQLDLLNSAALAALLILLAQPLEIFDPSFHFSFLAMGCIGGIAAPWLAHTVEPYARALRGWRDVTRDGSHPPRQAQLRIDLRSLQTQVAARFSARGAHWTGNGAVSLLSFSFRVWEIFVLSLVMQIGMLPLMAQQFHRITLAGPFANLVAVPLTTILVPLGFLSLGAGLVVRPIAHLLAFPLIWLTSLLVHLTNWFAHLPRWSYRIPGPRFWLLVLFFCLLATVAAAARLRATLALRTCVAILLICGALIALHPFPPETIFGKLEVTALDVAQGDSLFVVSPQGKTMLIDSGGAFGGFRPQEHYAGLDPGEEAVSPYLWSRGFQRLDIVALTHAHQDHIGGLTAILENFPVGQLWIGREVSSAAQLALEELARRKNIPIQHERRGNAMDWDGVRIQVLWPEIAPEEFALSAKNNDSLVLRFTFGKRVILLPGDIEKQAEREIAAETPQDALRANVLKVGHHGSKNSTLEEFLDRVQPQVAIISAGADNPYGHPSPEVLERLERAGVRVFRTDLNGAIHVLTDGERVEVYCYVACAAEVPRRPLGEAGSPDEDENPQH
jgi:competence protein ComEC